MKLFKNKCIYCREKIEKGREIFVEVEVPGYVGTFRKPFCTKEHADRYAKELANRPKKQGGGGCCG